MPFVVKLISNFVRIVVSFYCTQHTTRLFAEPHTKDEDNESYVFNSSNASNDPTIQLFELTSNILKIHILLATPYLKIH